MLNGRWDVLAWNEAAVRLLGDFGAPAGGGSQHPANDLPLAAVAELFVDWECLAESVVAQFRAETARHSGAPELLALTAALARESPEFAQLWRARAVDVPQLKVKRLQHRRIGRRRADVRAVAAARRRGRSVGRRLQLPGRINPSAADGI